ncbi:hypothetical protein LSH36_9g14054 [Paralvinella palmiformis]|uniref:Uncharacterized protein n=1 Tax=Paralvinella palmiformis TaxID=53620 RepID=A0AAD9KD95_9ANNE|nr:hypothetical protein LSH36_9g14054 [Paralvinella palmiformis]
MDLEVDGSDVEELVEEQQPSSAVKEMLKSWESVSAYVEKYLPDKVVDVRSTNLFNQNMNSHFRNILKRRQKESESEPSVEPEVIEPATEPELEIVSVEPSTSHSDKEKEKKL